jgi:GNAT superfamily N-acetyltransferase
MRDMTLSLIKTGISRHGPNGVMLHDVLGTDSPLLPIAIELFEALFVDYLRYVPYVRECALGRSPQHPTRVDHIWLAEKDGRFVGLNVFCYVHTCNIGFVGFMGVLDSHRHLGVGSWLMNHVHEQLRVDAARFGYIAPCGYLCESEPPEFAEDANERLNASARLEFLTKKCGGHILPVDYTEPKMVGGVDYITAEALADVPTPPMHLLFFPSGDWLPRTRDDYRRLLLGLYIDYYRVKEDDPLLLRALNSLEADDG